jgi:hypothetical protein
MSDSPILEALSTIQLPIVFTPNAWRRAVLLEHSDHPESLLLTQLSNVVRAALEAHLAHPLEPDVVFEVVQITSIGSPDHDSPLQLNLRLLQEPNQPVALLIALAGEP